MIGYNKNLGLACQNFRRLKRIEQKQVAEETGYSLESVSAFECGRSNNAAILLWYFYNGLSIEYIRMNGGFNE